jgi:hypothetical protein
MTHQPPPRFALKPSEKDSDCWRRLKKELEKRLESERARNDGLNQDERQTAYNRGRIAVLKDLIALDTPNSPPAS